MSPISKVDSIYRTILLSKFFTRGWGHPEYMKKIFKFRKIISNRQTCQGLVANDHLIYIDSQTEHNSTYDVFEGHFMSPLVQYLPELVPKESQIAKFQLILPKQWPQSGLKPVCLHLAGTGDHHFWRRRTLMAKPLLKEYGIASIILENPFYGCRKPPDQTRSSLKNVSDIFIMGGCLILESLALFNWCERMGFGPLCITGISMGGHNAALAGTNWHKPIGIVPCLSWTTASCAFTQGVMTGSIPWTQLEEEYLSYGEELIDELQKLIHSPKYEPAINQAFDAGRQFAKNFPNIFDSILEYDFIRNIFATKSTNISTTKTTTNNNNNNINSSIQPKAAAKTKTLDFMRGVMDECTHLANFSVPIDPELAIIVNATHDGYVPRQNVQPLTDIWPGARVRYVDGGHVSAILFNANVFRKAIAEALDLTAQKYYGNSLFDKPLVSTQRVTS
ncbi:protein ABHD18-like [Oppia nitens]|uniref:protein ABHD18-like n=1 Tax=Oppia nitens TaxID=1686743 RepID=UPI0023DACED3|nr:protein ABHD18-like [Oppia nitens]